MKGITMLPLLLRSNRGIFFCIALILVIILNESIFGNLFGWIMADSSNPDSSEFESNRAQRSSPRPENAHQSFTWAIFAIAKPLHLSNGQATAIYSWSVLKNPPSSIYCLGLEEGDAHEQILNLRKTLPNVKIVAEDIMLNGQIRQDVVFERASREPVDAVVVLNADLVLYDDLPRALQFVDSQLPRYFMIGSRYESPNNKTFRHAEQSEDWLARLRSATWSRGMLHNVGESDYYAWRPQGYSHHSAIGSNIPPFTYGFVNADNWIVDHAITRGDVKVVDATVAVMAIRLKHHDHLVQSESPSRSKRKNGQQSADDREATILNKYLVNTLGYFDSGGTPLHAPWALSYCTSARTNQDYICMRKRTRAGVCGCEYSAFVNRAVHDPYILNTRIVCGTLPIKDESKISHSRAFPLMIKQRKDPQNEIILISFHGGYDSMVLNTICRFNQLGITNYVISAFDLQARRTCRNSVLPCVVGSNSSILAEKATLGHGSKDFQELMKLKSIQVLKILRLGTNVIWTDVDIFWKTNPIRDIIREMKQHRADIAIQSNAPIDEIADNGYRRINPGFYYARSTANVIRAFEAIYKLSRIRHLSEHHSFYAVLCGDHRAAPEFRVGTNECYNPKIKVRTLFLSRSVYPNGAMNISDITATSKDSAAIVHFNWLSGYKSKVNMLMNAGMWLLEANTSSCKR